MCPKSYLGIHTGTKCRTPGLLSSASYQHEIEHSLLHLRKTQSHKVALGPEHGPGYMGYDELGGIPLYAVIDESEELKLAT